MHCTEMFEMCSERRKWTLWAGIQHVWGGGVAPGKVFSLDGLLSLTQPLLEHFPGRKRRRKEDEEKEGGGGRGGGRRRKRRREKEEEEEGEEGELYL